MKASQWIDLVKVYRQWESDYRAAKELGLSRNTISMYRTRTPTMDEETSVVVADALEIDPAMVVLDQVAERSKSDVVREALSNCIVKRPGDVMSEGYTATERAQIRAEVEEFGAAAIHAKEAVKAKPGRKKSSAVHGVVLAGLVATGFISTPPNAGATVIDRNTVSEGLYIMLIIAAQAAQARWG